MHTSIVQTYGVGSELCPKNEGSGVPADAIAAHAADVASPNRHTLPISKVPIDAAIGTLEPQ